MASLYGVTVRRCSFQSENPEHKIRPLYALTATLSALVAVGYQQQPDVGGMCCGRVDEGL